MKCYFVDFFDRLANTLNNIEQEFSEISRRVGHGETKNEQIS